MKKIDENEYYNYGRRSMEKGNYSEAERAFSEHLRRHPNDITVYLFRGYNRTFLQDFEGAICDCTKAIEHDANDGAGYFFRGIAQDYLSNYSDAISDFTKSIELNFNPAEAYCNRAGARCHLEDYYEALDDCNKAIELDSIFAGAYIKRGILKSELGHHRDAINDYNKGIELNSNREDAYVNRGIAKAYLGYFQEAIVDCNKAIEMNSVAVPAYSTLGKVYYDWKREFEKAISCYRVASKLDPKNPEWFFKLGNMYSKWEIRIDVEEPFFHSLGKYGVECQTHFVDNIAYKERKEIARGYYSRSFIDLFPLMRTDLQEDQDCYSLFLFVGNNDYLLSPLDDKCFFFSDARSFPDKTTDCPLLNPINQSILAVQVSYDNVRIRCLCNIDIPNGIQNCHSMWDRYANGHSGLAYKLRIEKKWLIDQSVYINRIKYVTSDEVMKCDFPEQVIEEGLFRKDISYADEKEWRLVKFGKYEEKKGIKLSWQCNDGTIGVSIEAIYIGKEASCELQNMLKEEVRGKNIKVYKMNLQKNSKLTFSEC